MATLYKTIYVDESVVDEVDRLLAFMAKKYPHLNLDWDQDWDIDDNQEDSDE